MNILRERKRSKVFERKCFQLNYEANRGRAGNCVTPVTRQRKLGGRQLASWVGMR